MKGSESYEIGGDGRGVHPTVDFQLNEQRRVAAELGKLIPPEPEQGHNP